MVDMSVFKKLLIWFTFLLHVTHSFVFPTSLPAHPAWKSRKVTLPEPSCYRKPVGVLIRNCAAISTPPANQSRFQETVEDVNPEDAISILDRAIARCRESISRNASNEEPWYFLGVLILQRGGSEAEALDALLRAAALRPDREDTWLRVAALHEAAGRAGLAAPAYMAALRADPSSWRALTGLGALLERGGDGSAAAALQAYARAAELAPAQADRAHAGAVRLLRLAGRAEAARAAADRFLAARPDLAAALCAMGECLQVLRPPPERALGFVWGARARAHTHKGNRFRGERGVEK